MTDRQIRCFLALYETLNFSAAARQLTLAEHQRAVADGRL